MENRLIQEEQKSEGWWPGDSGACKPWYRVHTQNDEGLAMTGPLPVHGMAQGDIPVCVHNVYHLHQVVSASSLSPFFISEPSNSLLAVHKLCNQLDQVFSAVKNMPEITIMIRT